MVGAGLGGADRASLAVFFVWVFPANQATANWTTQPEGWEALRSQWEYGRAVNAVVVFAAFLTTSLAVVRRGRAEAA